MVKVPVAEIKVHVTWPEDHDALLEQHLQAQSSDDGGSSSRDNNTVISRDNNTVISRDNNTGQWRTTRSSFHNELVLTKLSPSAHLTKEICNLEFDDCYQERR
jgi:hypothetical protein